MDFEFIVCIYNILYDDDYIRKKNITVHLPTYEFLSYNMHKFVYLSKF